MLPPLLLVGGGAMGSAMLSGWVEAGVSQVVVIDPAPMRALTGPAVTVVPNAESVPAGFDPACVILAVKPQMAGAALPGLARFGGVALSIMAGRTIAGLSAVLTGPVVRAMPNTPAAIRAGITVPCTGPGVSPAQRALCDALLRAVGVVEWVDEESMIDAVTAVSGGGPAYVFLLAELLEQAAIEEGLPAPLARRLARVTVAGSGALLAASDADAAVLRRQVTSPAGTTERALAVLMADAAWPALIPRAIAAATARSRELAATVSSFENKGSLSGQ